jgi:hypothetical protein
MFAYFALDLWLSLGTSFGAGLLAALLWRRGLAPAYRGFVAYLIAECICGLTLSVATMQYRSSTVLARFFLVLQPILWFFYVVMVREIHIKSLSRYRGIARVGQQVLVYGLIGSIVLSVATVQPDLDPTLHGGSVPILYLTAAHRVVTGGLTLFLLLLTAILNWFPVQTSRNMIVHTTLAFFFFLLMTVAHLYRNLTGNEVTQQVNEGIMAMGTVCLMAWAVLLRPAGEAARPQGPAGPAEDSWIFAQLEALNRALLRVVK